MKSSFKGWQFVGFNGDFVVASRSFVEVVSPVTSWLQVKSKFPKWS